MQRASARRLAFPAASALVVMFAAAAAQAQSAAPSGDPPAKAIAAIPEPDLGGAAGAQGLTLRVKDWQWPPDHAGAIVSARPSPPPRLAQNTAGGSRGARIAKRIVGGLVGGGGGFMVGGLVGSKLEPSCGCDDPGLRGFLIGAPIGAVLGAIAGVMSVP